MKEVFEQYGGVIITMVAIISLIAIIYALLQPDGVVYKAFVQALDDFYKHAQGFLADVPAK